MSGIVGSRLNIRGSGIVGSIGTDGQVLTSSGAGQEMVFEDASGFDVTSITGATELSANPADDDDFVFSDGGTLKKIEFQRLQSTNASCRMGFSPSGCTYAISNTTNTTSALGGNWSVGGNYTDPSGSSNFSNDSGTAMDDATNGRIYAKVDGVFMSHVQNLWEPNTTGFREIRIRDNTGFYFGWVNYNAEQTYAGLGQYIFSVAEAYIANVDDYSYLDVYQDSGGNLSLKGNGNPDRTCFTKWRVG